MANLQIIKIMAQKKNISMRDLASEVGITPQALALLMRKNSTSIDTLERIAHVLGVRPAVFFEDGGLAAIEVSQSVVGSNNSNNNNNSEAVVLKALAEVAEQRKLVAKAQDHISELTEVVLNLSKHP